MPNNKCQEVGEYIKWGRSDLAFKQIQKFFQEKGKINKGINDLVKQRWKNTYGSHININF